MNLFDALDEGMEIVEGWIFQGKRSYSPSRAIFVAVIACLIFLSCLCMLVALISAVAY